MVGGSMTAGETGFHACLYDAGGLIDLGTLGGSYSSAFGVNAVGQIVGQAMVPGNQAFHPFLWTNGQIRDLNSLLPAHAGWELEIAHAINDAGQIVGSGTHNGQPRAFLVIPAQ